MKLTKQILVTLIEEAMDEPINYGSPDYNAGLRDGNKRSIFLFKKGEKQSAKGLKNYIAKATEHRTASYKAGYRFAFELRFPAGGKSPLYTLEEEGAKAALDNKGKRE